MIEKHAARLKADQRRFMDRQLWRLQEMVIHPAFSVSPDRIVVTDQKSYTDRDKPHILLAEWTAKEVDGQVVVTRIESGYLRDDDAS
jgi:hypothetical protein